MQSWPRPWVIMKLTISGVTFSAAQMKSPSFSRSSASTTIDHPALADGVDGFFDRGKTAGHADLLSLVKIGQNCRGRLELFGSAAQTPIIGVRRSGATNGLDSRRIAERQS